MPRTCFFSLWDETNNSYQVYTWAGNIKVAGSNSSIYEAALCALDYSTKPVSDGDFYIVCIEYN